MSRRQTNSVEILTDNDDDDVLFMMTSERPSTTAGRGSTTFTSNNNDNVENEDDILFGLPAFTTASGRPTHEMNSARGAHRTEPLSTRLTSTSARASAASNSPSTAATASQQAFRKPRDLRDFFARAAASNKNCNSQSSIEKEGQHNSHLANEKARHDDGRSNQEERTVVESTLRGRDIPPPRPQNTFGRSSSGPSSSAAVFARDLLRRHSETLKEGYGYKNKNKEEREQWNINTFGTSGVLFRCPTFSASSIDNNNSLQQQQQQKKHRHPPLLFSSLPLRTRMCLQGTKGCPIPTRYPNEASVIESLCSSSNNTRGNNSDLRVQGGALRTIGKLDAWGREEEAARRRKNGRSQYGMDPSRAAFEDNIQNLHDNEIEEGTTNDQRKAIIAKKSRTFNLRQPNPTNNGSLLSGCTTPDTALSFSYFSTSENSDEKREGEGGIGQFAVSAEAFLQQRFRDQVFLHHSRRNVFGENVEHELSARSNLHQAQRGELFVTVARTAAVDEFFRANAGMSPGGGTRRGNAEDGAQLISEEGEEAEEAVVDRNGRRQVRSVRSTDISNAVVVASNSAIRSIAITNTGRAVFTKRNAMEMFDVNTLLRAHATEVERNETRILSASGPSVETNCHRFRDNQDVVFALSSFGHLRPFNINENARSNFRNLANIPRGAGESGGRGFMGSLFGFGAIGGSRGSTGGGGDSSDDGDEIRALLTMMGIIELPHEDVLDAPNLSDHSSERRLAAQRALISRGGGGGSTPYYRPLPTWENLDYYARCRSFSEFADRLRANKKKMMLRLRGAIDVPPTRTGAVEEDVHEIDGVDDNGHDDDDDDGARDVRTVAKSRRGQQRGVSRKRSRGKGEEDDDVNVDTATRTEREAEEKGMIARRGQNESRHGSQHERGTMSSEDASSVGALVPEIAAEIVADVRFTPRHEGNQNVPFASRTGPVTLPLGDLVPPRHQLSAMDPFTGALALSDGSKVTVAVSGQLFELSIDNIDPNQDKSRNDSQQSAAAATAADRPPLISEHASVPNVPYSKRPEAMAFAAIPNNKTHKHFGKDQDWMRTLGLSHHNLKHNKEFDDDEIGSEERAETRDDADSSNPAMRQLNSLLLCIGTFDGRLLVYQSNPIKRGRANGNAGGREGRDEEEEQYNKITGFDLIAVGSAAVALDAKKRADEQRVNDEEVERNHGQNKTNSANISNVSKGRGLQAIGGASRGGVHDSLDAEQTNTFLGKPLGYYSVTSFAFAEAEGEPFCLKNEEGSLHSITGVNRCHATERTNAFGSITALPHYHSSPSTSSSTSSVIVYSGTASGYILAWNVTYRYDCCECERAVRKVRSTLPCATGIRHQLTRTNHFANETEEEEGEEKESKETVWGDASDRNQTSTTNGKLRRRLVWPNSRRERNDLEQEYNNNGEREVFYYDLDTQQEEELHMTDASIHAHNQIDDGAFDYFYPSRRSRAIPSTESYRRADPSNRQPFVTTTPYLLAPLLFFEVASLFPSLRGLVGALHVSQLVVPSSPQISSVGDIMCHNHNNGASHTGTSPSSSISPLAPQPSTRLLWASIAAGGLCRIILRRRELNEEHCDDDYDDMNNTDSAQSYSTGILQYAKALTIESVEGWQYPELARGVQFGSSASSAASSASNPRSNASLLDFRNGSPFAVLHDTAFWPHLSTSSVLVAIPNNLTTNRKRLKEVVKERVRGSDVNNSSPSSSVGFRVRSKISKNTFVLSVANTAHRYAGHHGTTCYSGEGESAYKALDTINVRVSEAVSEPSVEGRGAPSPHPTTSHAAAGRISKVAAASQRHTIAGNSTNNKKNSNSSALIIPAPTSPLSDGLPAAPSVSTANASKKKSLCGSNRDLGKSTLQMLMASDDDDEDEADMNALLAKAFGSRGGECDDDSNAMPPPDHRTEDEDEEEEDYAHKTASLTQYALGHDDDDDEDEEAIFFSNLSKKQSPANDALIKHRTPLTYSSSSDSHPALSISSNCKRKAWGPSAFASTSKGGGQITKCTSPASTTIPNQKEDKGEVKPLVDHHHHRVEVHKRFDDDPKLFSPTNPVLVDQIVFVHPPNSGLLSLRPFTFTPTCCQSMPAEEAILVGFVNGDVSMMRLTDVTMSNNLQ